MKKILAIVISDLGSGGAQRVLMNLIESWRFQYRVVVITLSHPDRDFFKLPELVERIFLSEINASANVFQGLLANFKRIILLRRHIKQLKPQKIISFICPTNILTILATRGLKIETIISERNDPERQSFGWIWDQLRRRCYRRADWVTANSKGVLKKMTYVPSQKLHWVPNPLVLPKTEAPPIIFNQPTFLAVGRLHHQKGYDLLLKAFAIFLKNNSAWRLVILGEGALRSVLEALCVDLNIQDQVIFQGTVQNPFPFYQAATIFIMASRHEGVPNALLEAMSAGLPAIITDASPGPLEYIEHQENGWVVPAENIEALAQAMQLLANNPLLREQLAQKSLEKIQESSLENALAAWEKI